MKPITRRNMLTGMAASTGAVALSAASEADEKPSAEPGATRIIVAGGHPGDPEYGCGGTIARLTDDGHEVVLLYLNQGDPSAKTLAEASNLRVIEATNACEILNARPAFADQIDGNSVVDREHYDQFRKLLQTERAETANDPGARTGRTPHMVA